MAAVVVVAIVVLAGTVVGVRYWSVANYKDLEYVGFDHDRVAAIEAKLCSWPTRHTGTPYAAEVADYISSQFTDAGLKNVAIEEYDEVDYEVRGAGLALVPYINGPLGLIPDPRRDPEVFVHKVDFVVQGFSGSLDQASGPTAFLSDLEFVKVEGNGSESAQYLDAAGKVAVIDTGPDVGNTQVMEAAHEAGVAAVLMRNVHIHENINYAPISKSSRQPATWPDPDYPDVPLLMLSRDCGDTILGASSAKLRMNVDVDIGMRKVRVVTGEVPGTRTPDELVVIGAHDDSVYINQGAVDDGSGTTTVIELAHQLSHMKPERTIRLCAFGAEEDGLFGSFAYTEAHKDELAKCRGMLNFDMPHIDLTRGNQGWVTPDDKARFGLVRAILDDVYEADPELREVYNISVEWQESPEQVGSDSMPFAMLGVETCNFWGSGSWEYHTYMDDITHFSPEGLKMAVLMGGSYAMWLADH
jgi:hypothetical protein